MLTTDLARVHLLEIPQSLLPALIAGHRSVAVLFGDSLPESPSTGERVFVRTGRSGPLAVARVGRVDAFDDLVPAQIEALRATFGDRAAVTDDGWNDARWARAALVVWLEQIRQVPLGVIMPAALSGSAGAGWRSAVCPEHDQRLAA